MSAGKPEMHPVPSTAGIVVGKREARITEQGCRVVEIDNGYDREVYLWTTALSHAQSEGLLQPMPFEEDLDEAASA